MSSYDGVKVSQEFLSSFCPNEFLPQTDHHVPYNVEGCGTLLWLALKKILLWQTRQEPAVTAPVEGVSGVVAAMASIGEAQPMAMSMREQAEEGTSGAPVAGAAWLVMSSTSHAEVARLEPSFV